jgi:uncharacterized protein (TIGR02466 family)
MAASENLFATPLLVDNIDDAEINAGLETAILERRAQHPGVKRSNLGGWHSDLSLLEWGGAPARKLLDRVLALVNANTAHSAGKGAQFGWRIEAWANVNERGSANSRHVHGGCYWSAVYYVRVDAGEGGRLILHDPRMPALAMHAPYLRFRNAGGERQLQLKPVVGRLIVFPSWLAHEVEPWDGDGLRISIALNLTATPGRAPAGSLKQKARVAKAPPAPKE